MNTADHLRAARNKIARPENWTKKSLARDAAGSLVDYTSPYACCFCIVGAVIVTSPNPGRTAADIWGWDARSEALRLLGEAANTNFLPTFNDNATHDGVLAVFDEAIARAMLSVDEEYRQTLDGAVEWFKARPCMERARHLEKVAKQYLEDEMIGVESYEAVIQPTREYLRWQTY